MLLTNEAKAARERLTLIRIHEELRALGYAGSYDAVRRIARQWRRGRVSSSVGAYVPLNFAPDEAYQVDWSHEIMVLSGATMTVKVVHVRLCHSRMFVVRAYPRETQEMVFDAHDQAFALFRGTCTHGIYDNMRTAGYSVLRPGSGCSTAALPRCARIIWWSRSPARRRRAGASLGAPAAEERHDILEITGTLELTGMRAAFDEVIAESSKPAMTAGGSRTGPDPHTPGGSYR